MYSDLRARTMHILSTCTIWIRVYYTMAKIIVSTRWVLQEFVLNLFHFPPTTPIFFFPLLSLLTVFFYSLFQPSFCHHSFSLHASISIYFLSYTHPCSLSVNSPLYVHYYFYPTLIITFNTFTLAFSFWWLLFWFSLSC